MLVILSKLVFSNLYNLYSFYDNIVQVFWAVGEAGPEARVCGGGGQGGVDHTEEQGRQANQEK